MSGLRHRVVAAGLASLVAGCATVHIRDARVVSGLVADESGQPVANTPVLIVGRSLELNATRLEYEERGRREVRGVTGADGRYRIEFVPGSLGNNFFLFFHDKTGFDRVRYRRPEPVDITALLERDRSVTVNQVLQAHPAWPEVERQIAFYGPASERGRILRSHGLPEKREGSRTGGAEAEIWWYYADGVAYWFAGDRLTRTDEFSPIPGRTPAR